MGGLAVEPGYVYLQEFIEIWLITRLAEHRVLDQLAAPSDRNRMGEFHIEPANEIIATAIILCALAAYKSEDGHLQC